MCPAAGQYGLALDGLLSMRVYLNRGPNWIHASGDPDHPNPVLQAAISTSTPLHHWNNKQLIYDTSGEPLPDDVTERLSTLLWELIEAAFSYSEKACDKAEPGIPSQDSLYDFIKREAGKRLEDEEERSLLLEMSHMFGAYVGEPVWKQSLRFAWMEGCCGGGELLWFRTSPMVRAVF
jgi:hypothetical protein